MQWLRKGGETKSKAEGWQRNMGATRPQASAQLCPHSLGLGGGVGSTTLPAKSLLLKVRPSNRRTETDNKAQGPKEAEVNPQLLPHPCGGLALSTA